MTNNLTAEILRELPLLERRKLITQQSLTIDIPGTVHEDLHKAYKLSKVIYPILPAYFHCQFEQARENGNVLRLDRQSELILSKTDEFADAFISWMKRDFNTKKNQDFSNPSNLFELCGATLLITSNSVTRNLSTKLGQLWEKLANISPYVISPEFEFGIKITGVDIILYSENTVSFAQLKTAKGTLTGSQKNRAIQELSIHENSLFIVSFDIGSWTFPLHSKIPRIVGKDFWHKINMDYGLIENHVKNMIQRIDTAFAELADGET